MSFFAKRHLDARTRRIMRSSIALAFDTIMAGGAFFFAFVTVYSLDTVMRVPGIPEKSLAFALASCLSFLLFRQYRTSWRYVSIPDLMTIIRACIVGTLLYTAASFIITRGQNVPRTVPILTFVYLVGLLSSARIGFRIFVEQFGRNSRFSVGRPVETRKVLLCGFSDKAESFIRSNRRSLLRDVAIVGILDDSNINLGRYVQGVKVIGTLEGLDDLIRTLARNGTHISELIVTENTPGRKRLAHIVSRANAHGITVSRIPDLTEMPNISGETLFKPRPIELGDLLERPEASADLEGVARLIAGKIVLVTGAGGSIGSELSRQIASFGPKQFIITDNSEFFLYSLETGLRDKYKHLNLTARIVDVRDSTTVRMVFAEFKPEVVFHAAALKHVPLMEKNPLEAIKTNLLGTRNVADAALASQTSTFVMISTDKAVNPTNIMGATKRAAEAYCQALDVSAAKTRFKTVRFGNVLGSNGSVVPRFRDQIAAGGPVTVTHPHIVRYFMTIPEAVELVLHASAHALRNQTQRGKIMVLDMGKPVRIADLAERMIQLAGYKPDVDIDIVFTGLRPGEKLYEELFDPSEVQDSRTADGYVVAAPRIVDRMLLDRTLAQIESLLKAQDCDRAIQLLLHLVPEYRKSSSQMTATSTSADSADAARSDRLPTPQSGD